MLTGLRAIRAAPLFTTDRSIAKLELNKTRAHVRYGLDTTWPGRGRGLAPGRCTRKTKTEDVAELEKFEKVCLFEGWHLNREVRKVFRSF